MTEETKFGQIWQEMSQRVKLRVISRVYCASVFNQFIVLFANKKSFIKIKIEIRLEESNYSLNE